MWKDHREAAVAVDAVWTTRSPLSRVGATERRSRDHDSHHTNYSQRANKLPTMPLATKLLCSCHLLPKQPDPAIDRGSVGVSFSSSHKVGSSSKRCLPEVKIRCVLTADIVRATSDRPCRLDVSTCEDLLGALRAGTGYPAGRCHAPTRGRVCEVPSGRHGRAVSEAAVAGTHAWTAVGHREVIARCQKKFPTAPLPIYAHKTHAGRASLGG